MTAIDYGRLALAVDFYEAHGFSRREVPWIVGYDAYHVTKPPEAISFATLGGYLVASAEQSFIQMILDKQLPGRAVAITPCFRHERYDELHKPYFMKVELIDTIDTSLKSLKSMIATAEAFFSQFTTVTVVPMGGVRYDIVQADTGIELGSYGRNRLNGVEWLYGTGLAEPRLSSAIDIATRQEPSCSV